MWNIRAAMEVVAFAGHFLVDTVRAASLLRIPLESTRPFRLLFVEDSDQLRETMAILLEADGREVVTVAQAEEALALHTADPFDLVVTDLTLGAMSGADLARAVLARDPAAWVVLASGYAIDPALRALGPNVRVLAKPFTSAAIEAVVDELGGAGQVSAARRRAGPAPAPPGRPS